MIQVPTDINELMATMQRPEVGGPIRGVKLPRDGMQKSLSIKPEVVDGTLGEMGQIAGELPCGVLSSKDKGPYRRFCYAGQGTVLRNFAAGVRRSPRMTQGDGPKPEVLEQIARRLWLCAYLSRTAAGGLSSMMDLRLMLGALQWFMLQTVLTYVVGRLEDPATTKAERDKLMGAFAGLLLHKELLLMTNEQRRLLFRTHRDQMQQEVQKAERHALVEDMRRAVRLGLPYDKEKLAAAAVYYYDEKHAAAKHPAGHAPATPAPTGAPGSPPRQFPR